VTGTGIDGVARATGVSTATVSRALRGLPGVSAATRDRVLAAAEELGYVPSSSAAHLASGRTMALGVLLPRIDEWYFAAALEGVDRALRAAGYDLAVFSLGGSGRNRERVFHRSMLRKRIDALLVMCMELTPEELTALQQLDYPSLTVGGYVEGLRNVSIDDAAAAGDAVDHLVSLGHRKIAYLAGGDGHGVHFSVPARREAAFRRSLARHGLPVRPEWMVFGDFRFGAAKAAAERLLGVPGERPTAVFASSDEMAFGVLAAAQERGVRVPEELSVIGIDDHDFSGPLGLTTVRQDPREQGSYAAELLLAELRGGPAQPNPPWQPHRLVVRRSTGPPAGYVRSRRPGAPFPGGEETTAPKLFGGPVDFRSNRSTP
jgi:LacI family repressor for deo operon, udp, cdd, tsx, nupC, and nupG